jgi:DNA-binding response OmpR family regulator
LLTENRSNSKHTIIVVDDEELIRNLVVTFLFKMGYSCLTAVDGIDALEKIKENKIDAVITDIKMPNMDGILLTGEILKQYPQIPVMVMTAFDEEYSAGTAISVGAQEFIRKPFSLDEFAIRLHKMIRDSEMLRKVKGEKNEEDNMQSLMDDLEKALKDDSKY